MPRPSTPRIRSFQDKVLLFYREHARPLPWRRTRDPYRILVSEVMLQQTQADRVIPFYLKWVRKWPTVQALAQATRREVLQEWMGLGYNNRAVHLHETARLIVQRFGGDVLAALDRQEKLPGIGPYTSQAVQIFSRNAGLATVDTNIRRILLHEFGPLSDPGLLELARRCLPPGRSRDWHNGLMDYGALLLTSRRTGIRAKTRQSSFKGSDRQLRARIVRHLLQVGTASAPALQKLAADRARLEKILAALQKDGLVRERGGRYSLEETR